MRKYEILSSEAKLRADTERLARRDKEKRKGEVVIDDDAPFFSKKKNIVRLVLFIVAFAVAVFFITRAVYLMIHKDPGWYEIECESDKEVPYYSSGVTFNYEFTGSSSEIGKLMKSVTDLYTRSLKSNYKLLDASTTYDDAVNVASVNASRGEWIKVTDALFDVLKDAYDKTCREESAYNVLGGVFASIRDPIVYSDTPVAADPEYDATAAEMLSRLAEIEEKSSPTLEFDEDNRSVRLTVPDELVAFCEEYELPVKVLDLDTLRAAYVLKNVTHDLEEAGFTDGYIVSDNGITVFLSGMNESQILMYSNVIVDGEVETAVSASSSRSGPCAAAAFRVFPLYEGEYGFYSFMKDGKTYYRNKYMTDFETAGKGFSALAISDNENPVAAAYAALTALKGGVLDKIDFTLDENVIPVVELAGERGVIYSPYVIDINEDAGFTFEQLYYK